MKRFVLLMFVLTLLAPQAWVLGAEGPKPKKKVITVPEPTTMTLLVAAAGAAVARKLWRNRQR